MDALTNWLNSMIARRQAQNAPMGPGGQLGGWSPPQGFGLGSFFPGMQDGEAGGFSPPPGFGSHWNGGQMAPGGNAQLGQFNPGNGQPRRPAMGGPQPNVSTGPGAQMSGFSPPQGFGLSSFTGGGGQMAGGGNALAALFYGNR